uniref:adenylyl-sulfate kinase n=1 Tax=Mastigamoeba balamuthi TaxID=108607 RepID=A0A0B4R3E5_MASBA|nr:adenylyl-sulfate kinase [Mastigamoeba balamuthi]|eukprot:m51a1_g10467 putative adenylylsulfate kinase (529) ;mRNA; r:47209-48986
MLTPSPPAPLRRPRAPSASYTPPPLYGRPAARPAMASGAELAALRAPSPGRPEHVLRPRQLAAAEMVLSGALAPLAGFMTRREALHVASRGALASGAAWPLPVTLGDEEGRLVAVMEVEDVWQEGAGEWRVGGELRGVEAPVHRDLARLRTTPAAVRSALARGPHASAVAHFTRHAATPRAVAVARSAPESIAGPAACTVLCESDADYVCRALSWEAALRGGAGAARLSLVPAAVDAPRTRDGLLRLAALRSIVARNYGFSHVSVGPEPEHLDGLVGLRDSLAAAREMQQPTGVVPVLVGEAEQEALARELAALREGDLARAGARGRVARVLSTRYAPGSARGVCLFFTGLSGSGKSTIANAVAQRLLLCGDARPVVVLDGDVVRHNLSKGLGFSKADRRVDANIERIGFVASLVVKCRGVAICAPIAPYEGSRARARQMCGEHGAFVEVHVATPLAECERRDTKGLYARARQGLLKGLTGVDDPYEEPRAPELRIDTAGRTLESCVDEVMSALARMKLVHEDPQADS